MNGYDLLLIGFMFFLVWLIVKTGIKYYNWTKWDQYRRRQRKNYRLTK